MKIWLDEENLREYTLRCKRAVPVQELPLFSDVSAKCVCSGGNIVEQECRPAVVVMLSSSLFRLFLILAWRHSRFAFEEFGKGRRIGEMQAAGYFVTHGIIGF